MSSNNDLIMSGLILLVAGMGMTFIFLTIQVWCTNFFSKLSSKLQSIIPDPEPKNPVKKAVVSQQDDVAVVAAIAAALHHNANR